MGFNLLIMGRGSGGREWLAIPLYGRLADLQKSCFSYSFSRFLADLGEIKDPKTSQNFENQGI